MPIRLTGMSSGLDTEALVSELVSAYRTKEQKYEKAQTKLSWKMDAWKTMNSKTYSFYNNISSLRFSSAYSLKKTTVSNSTKVSVTAGNKAVNGTQTLNITNLAKSGYLTGDVLSPTKNKAGASTTLGELTYKDASDTEHTFSGEGTISVNGKEITLKSDMSIQDVVGKLKDAGVNASFDETNQRIFVSSEKSGEAADFSMIALDADGAKALKSLGLYTGSAKGAANYSKYEALNTEYEANGGSDTRAEWLKKKLKDYNDMKTAVAQAESDEAMYQKAITLKRAMDTIKSVSGGDEAKQLLMDNESRFISNGTVYDKKTDEDGNEYYVASKNPDGVRYYVNLSEPADANEQYASKLTDLKTADEYLTEQGIDAEARSNYRAASSTAAAYLKDDTIDAELKTKIETEQITQKELENKLAGITADKQAKQDALDKDAILAGYAQSFAAADGDTATQDAIVNSLDAQITFAMTATTGADPAGIGYNAGAVRINGEDAEIYLNGARFTSDSNTFSINGLTINATGTTIDKNDINDATKAAEAAITITTTTDSQGVYDKIKDFISEYNSLINDMTKSYNAANAKDYEPLTDDEKDAMTDSQVEKWEQKIKDSLLRRDTTLGGVVSAMTKGMSRSYNINGKDYALSSFGIKTLGYGKAEKYEENAYHIDGDADDDTVSGNADKLLAAINEDPDGVMQFFQQLTQDLYSSLGDKMGATSLSSTQTIYNDKEMAKEYSDYTTTIAKWEDKVSKIEDSYYKKFAAMEKALSELQSKTSQLSGLLGN